MVEPLVQLRSSLKDNKLSLTQPRRQVFEVLQSSDPLSMHHLVLACPDMDRATVYRTVELFERLGVVQRLQIGWKYKLELSDAFQHHHHHLTCLACGTIIPLPEDAILENRLTTLSKDLGFTPQDHQLEIRGLCANCRT